jgi:hypothetical protein
VTLTLRVTVVAMCIMGWLLPHAATAQSPAASGPSMTFVGAGLGVTSSGAAGRVEVTAFPERSLVAPRVEAGLAVGPRVGIGASWVGFAEINGDHNIARLPVEDRQREQAWVAELRWRALLAPYAAFDVVAGGGILRQQREGSYTVAAAPCTPACPVTTVTAEPSRASPVFTAGFDLPARLAPHVSVAASGRIYWMRRGELDVLTWPRDNSVEFAAFLMLRLTR